MSELSTAMGQLRLIVRYYADLGIHSGEFKVSLEGYLTPAQLDVVRAALAERFRDRQGEQAGGEPWFAEKHRRYEKITGILGSGITPETFAEIERVYTS